MYGCDICQDVCPWNRGVEKRRAGLQPPPVAEPVVSLLDWLEADGDELVARYDRLYVPRNDPRWLRRNALVAAGNVGGDLERDAVATYATGEDELLREHAELGARADRRTERAVKLIRNLAFVRIALVPLALIKILLDRDDFPTAGYEQAAWTLLGIFAALALVLLVLSYHWRGRLRYLAALGVVTDFAVTSALMFVFAWEPGQPLRALPFLVILEAALFFRLFGGLIAGAATLPVLLVLEYWRHDEFGFPVRYDALVLRVVVGVALGVVVGRLVDMERGQAHDAEERAAEAERLRDELGRRVDLLEATSRAARALGSSLDLDSAFAAFVRELRSLLPFDRAAILLAEGRRGARDGDRRRRRRGLPGAGHRDHGAGIDPRGGDRGGTHHLPRGHRRGAVPGGGRPARARVARARARAAAAGDTVDRRARDLTDASPGRSGRRSSAW